MKMGHLHIISNKTVSGGLILNRNISSHEQVERNPDRFPEDFVFQLTKEEADFWLRSRSHIATLKQRRNIKYLPYAFTEHGAIMAASVLRT